MKKYLLLLLMMLGMTFGSTFEAQAQTYCYRSTQFAIKYMYNGVWGNWSDWEPSNLEILIDFTNMRVIVKSRTTQVYTIVYYNGESIDMYNGQQMSFNVIDQDNDRGTMRFRRETNGNLQLYIDFANVAWVYNIRQTY